MRTVWLCLCIAAATAALSRPAHAQRDDGSSAEIANQRPPRPMSLRQVLDVVVQQNPALARARVDIATAGAGILESAGLDDWRVGASGEASATRSQFVEGQPFQTTASDTLALSADVLRPLATGGTVGLSLGGSYNRTTFAVLDAEGNSFAIDSVTFSNSLIASLDQPLLSGRGRRIARAPQRRAEVVRDRAALEQLAAAAAAVREVSDAYWELAYAIRAVEIQQGALELAREQLRITEAAIRAKVAARTEALAVRQAIAVREQAVLVAEIAVSEQSLELRRLAGLEIGPGEIAIAVTDPLRDDGRRFDIDQALGRARAHNPTLALARLARDSAAIDLEVAEDAVGPRLDLNASVGPTGNANDAGDALEQMATFDAFSATLGLTYSHTLKRRAARGARARARQLSARAGIDIAEAEREIAVLVVRAINRVRSARKRVEVGDLAIELAEQNLETERRLFEAGSVRSFDVLERQDELARARLDRERAVVDYLEAVAEVEALTGDLLAAHDIELLPR